MARQPSDSDKPQKQGGIDRRKATVMHIFRDAFAAGEGRNPHRGDDDPTRHALERRHGTDDATLRRHLAEDIADLLATIRLEAAADLDEADYVRRSVVNHGFRDLSSISSSELNTAQIAASIRNTLIANEPRLIPETIEVSLEGNRRNHRLKFSISAEMASDPVDIPVDFVAEVDLGAGRVDTTKAGT